MLGSRLPKRWIASLALVGLVVGVLTLYPGNSTVWAAECGGTTPTGSIPTTNKLTSVRIEPDAVSLNAGQSIRLDAIAGCGAAGNESKNLINTTYSWSAAAGHTLSATTGQNVVVTAGSSSGAITVTATQNGGGGPFSGTRTVTIVVSSTDPVVEPTPVDPSGDEPTLPAAASGTTQVLVSSTKGGAVAAADAKSRVSVPIGGVQNQYVGVTIADSGVSVAKPEGFTALGNVIQISTIDTAGAVLAGFTYQKPIDVCFSYSASDYDAAHGGVLAVFKQASAEENAINLGGEANPATSEVCAKTNSTSLFFLAAADTPPALIPATPTPVPTPVVVVEEVIILPATGDVAAGNGLLFGLIAGGLALIGAGFYAVKRSNRA